MNELDGRKQDYKTLEEFRTRAVKRVEAGESPEAVIKTLGFSRSRSYEGLPYTGARACWPAEQAGNRTTSGIERQADAADLPGWWPETILGS